MGHLRDGNEAENELPGNLGGLRERQNRSYGRHHPTVWGRTHFQPRQARVKEQDSRYFWFKNAEKPAALAGGPCQFPSEHTG